MRTALSRESTYNETGTSPIALARKTTTNLNPYIMEGVRLAIHVSQYIGTGITPQRFMEGMTRNQDKFLGWYESFAWPSKEDREFFAGIREGKTWQGGLRCLILMADWCGDVVRNVPVVFRAMEEAGVPVDVLILEEHLDLMDEHFLTMGGRSVPVVIFVDSSGDVIHRWGPRPAYVQEPMVEFKRTHPDKSSPDYESDLAATRTEIMNRYGTGTGYQADILREIREILS